MDRIEMARWVESLLNVHPKLASLRRWGIRVQVASNESTIVARAIRRGSLQDESWYARLAADGWWEPGDDGRGSEIAYDLACKLLEAFEAGPTAAR